MGYTYDIIFQNNSSREIFLLQGLEDKSDSNRYLQFEDVQFPSGMNDGEYSYYCLFNGRDDVIYEFNSTVLKSVLHTDEGDIVLGDLRPFIGLLRVGDVEEKNVYKKDEKNKIFYYKKDK